MTELNLKHPTTRSAVAAYAERLAAAWSRVHADTHVHQIEITSTVVELQICGDTMDEALFPALAHLAATTNTERTPNIVFHLWDGGETGAWPSPPPFVTDDYHRYGQRAVAHHGATSVMYAPFDGLLYAYNQESHQGYFWCRNAANLSIYERAAPAQTLFHWALRADGWQVVHAAAVGTERGGVLMIGSTGAGKSTTALSCLAQDELFFLSDDKCLMRLSPTPQAFALFSSAKIKGDMLERLPHFRPLLAGWDDSYKANKGLVFLHPRFSEQMMTSFPIRALLLPVVTNSDRASIRPAAASDVFRQLGPSTVIWLPGAETSNYRFTAEMVRRLPCYRLELSFQPEDNRQAIIDMLANH